MKRILLVSLLAISTISLAQETKNKNLDPDVCFYYGVGINANNDYKIDDKLVANNFPRTVKTMPELFFGINYLGKDFSIDTELATATFKKSNAISRSSGTAIAFKLRGHYNIVNQSRFMFSGGLNLDYTMNDFSLSATDNQVDLNNLGSSTSSYIRLHNKMFYVGPSIAFSLKKKDRVAVRLNIGYEFALASSKWRSEYAEVTNSFSENGHNKFMVGLVFYSNRHCK